MAATMNNSEDQTLAVRKLLHNTVYCQCFSNCGKYLAVGDKYGKISVFSLGDALGVDATEESRKPTFSFQAHKGAIYSLVSNEQFLISGGCGDILGWRWSDITKRDKIPKVAFSFSIPSVTKFDFPETNSLVLHEAAGVATLYAGCGDSKIHVWDLTSGEQINSLEGHNDYIHCVTLKANGTQCVSASEDGTVRIWDIRSQDTVCRLEPYKNESCARPQIGKWVGCVAVDPAEDWLVCGGGPQLAMWHLRSLAATSVYSAGDCRHQHVMFHEDSVISGGSEPYVYHWAVNGVQKAKVPCTPHSVFGIAINHAAQSTKVLSVVGNSPKVDICTNHYYKAFNLTVS